ncbi:AIPR family protein [Archangium primigenium]|nr:AIPR family protein [Archangium primigenium]
MKGISIVNGAQTTGAIGSLDNPPVQNAMVPARFIKCTSPDLVQEIVRYNNSQNKVAPADFRSTDAIQDRLRQEFNQRPNKISYLGGRRGGAQDAIQRPGSGNHIPSDTAAQSLTAFHGNPSVAYSRKSDIWESDKYYSSVFSDHTNSEHILFVCASYQIISKIKMDLFQKKEEQLTESDRENLNFFRLRGSIHMFMAAIGACMETILGYPVPSKFNLRFRKHLKLAEAEQAWRPVIECCIPFQSALRPPLEESLTTTVDTKQPIAQFRSFVNSTRPSNKKIYDEFSTRVTAEPLLSKKK